MRVFYINLTLSILLIAGGFVCPPMGVIDGSVLTAVGLLLALPVFPPSWSRQPKARPSD